MKRRTLLISASLGVLLGFGNIAAHAQNQVAGTVRIAPLQSTNLLTLTRQSGQADKYLKSIGGKIDWKASMPAYAPTAEVLRGGSADIGSGSVTSFLTAAANNKDLVIFAVEKDDGRTQGIVANGASGISGIPDLVGKRIAVNKGGTGEYLLRLALARHNIPYDKVTPVYLGPTEGATAFAQGHVDAWAVWEQFFAAGQAVPGAKVIAWAGDIGSLNRIVHVTTRDFAQRNPKLLKAVYDSLAVEAQAIKKDPSLIAALNIKEGMPKDVAAILRKVQPQALAPADDAFLKELDEVAKFYVSQGLTPQKIDVKGLTVNVLNP